MTGQEKKAYIALSLSDYFLLDSKYIVTRVRAMLSIDNFTIIAECDENGQES